MFMAMLLCSDGDCAELFEAYGSLEELQALACECGCSFELIALSEAPEEAERRGGFELIPVS